jgi:hypothetical protein
MTKPSAAADWLNFPIGIRGKIEKSIPTEMTKRLAFHLTHTASSLPIFSISLSLSLFYSNQTLDFKVEREGVRGRGLRKRSVRRV